MITTNKSPFDGEVARIRGALGMAAGNVVVVVAFVVVVVVGDEIVVVVVDVPEEPPAPSENTLEAVRKGAPVSSARTVKVKLVAGSEFGPVNCPALESVKPGGSIPDEIDHVHGVVAFSTSSQSESFAK